MNLIFTICTLIGSENVKTLKINSSKQFLETNIQGLICQRREQREGITIFLLMLLVFG